MPSQAVQSEELLPKKPSFKDLKPEQEAPIPKKSDAEPWDATGPTAYTGRKSGPLPEQLGSTHNGFMDP